MPEFQPMQANKNEKTKNEQGSGQVNFQVSWGCLELLIKLPLISFYFYFKKKEKENTKKEEVKTSCELISVRQYITQKKKKNRNEDM